MYYIFFLLLFCLKETHVTQFHTMACHDEPYAIISKFKITQKQQQPKNTNTWYGKLIFCCFFYIFCIIIIFRSIKGRETSTAHRTQHTQPKHPNANVVNGIYKKKNITQKSGFFASCFVFFFFKSIHKFSKINGYILWNENYTDWSTTEHIITQPNLHHPKKHDARCNFLIVFLSFFKFQTNIFEPQYYLNQAICCI